MIRIASETMRKCFYAWAACCVACGSTNESRFQTGGAGTGDTSGGGSILMTTGTGSGTGTGAGGSGVVIPPDTRDAGGTKESGVIATLPPDFTRTEVGGFKLIGELGLGSDAGIGDPSTGSDNCGNILNGVVRDFKGRAEPGGHPDFQGPLYGNNITPGLVAATLGADQKPVYSALCEEGLATGAACPFQAETTTQANFDQWYRYVAGVNKPLLVSLYFAPQANGLFRFSSLYFFPIDNAGWGNSCNCNADDGKMHNFSFTTELHTRFAYNGGETFTFQGDDDVWVFINGHLAVDVGGLHPPETQTVTLDTSATALGIQRGTTYNLDLFHAERHTPQSTFTIDTNLAFVNCGIVLPPDIPR